MTAHTLTALAGLTAIATAAATIAQPTTTPRTSPSTPQQTTPGATPRTSPSTPQPTTPGATPRTSPSTPQQPTTPGATPRTTPSTPQQPTTPGSTPTSPAQTPGAQIPPTVSDPGAQPVLPPDAEQPIIETPIFPGPLVDNDGRVFAVDPAQQAQFQQLSQRLARLEAQLRVNNDQILQQLGEARMTADTNTRLDRLAGVLQSSLLQNRILLQYLVDIRTSLTGQVNTDNTNTNPGTGISPDGTVSGQPGATPSGPGTRTVPGSLQGPSPTSPRTPEVAPSTPGRPTAPVTQSPGSGGGSPTRTPGSTTPTTPPATGTPSTSPSTPPSTPPR